jgi:hypothetical protein
VRWAGDVGEALREELAPFIGTLPAPERLFSLRRVSLLNAGTIDTIQKQKNIVIAAPLSDSTREARYLRARLDSASVAAVMGGQYAVVARPDLWRDDQLVYYILAADAEGLRAALREHGEDIRYAFNTITRERMEVDMFDKGRQPSIEQRLLDDHQFAVNAQHDYFVGVDTTNFVWLRRVVSADSWRSLFVWYTDELSPADLTPEWVMGVRDRLTQAYVQGNMGGYVEIDERRPLEAENINFLDRFAYEIRGLWHMVGPDERTGEIVPYGMGGPFLTYAFYDQPTGRTYVIDGMVFAPGFEKREFLRQMEVIAHTFRTREEVEAASNTATASR